MSNLSLERLVLDYTEQSITAHQGGTWTIDSITNAVTVSATDFDIRDLSASQDNVAISDGTDTLAVNADGSINAVVTATDLDIRDLTHASDSIKIGDGTDFLEVYLEDAASAGGEAGLVMLGIRQDAAGSPVSTDGDFHPFVFNNDGELKVAADLSSSVADDDADSGNPIKVGGRGYDVGAAALSALSNSNDRFDLLGDLYRRQFINDAPNVGLSNAAVSVSTTATQLDQSQAGRTRVLIQNNGSAPIFVGDASVTTANGIEVGKESTLALEAGEAISIYAICASGTVDTRVLELG